MLDASALLAILNREPGAERLTPQLLSGAAISAVNLAEVHGRLEWRGMPSDDAWDAKLAPVGEAVAFTAEHAKLAGELIPKTRQLGLLLGDRACLSLALALNAPVYTADRAWKKLRLAVRVHGRSLTPPLASRRRKRPSTFGLALRSLRGR